jgi:hypothetical protein
MEEELSSLAKKIISQLVFEETFDHIVEDVKDAGKYAIADEIKMLIAKDILHPRRDLISGKTSGFIYDSDHMEHYSFGLTAKGISLLENLLKE